MSKQIKNILIVFISIFTILITATNIIYYKQKSNFKNRESLPEFTFYKGNVEVYRADMIKNDKIICLFYYNSDCEFCQHEAIELQKNIKEFEETEIIMISTNTPGEAKLFRDQYKLNYKFITWLHDKDRTFPKWFGKSIAPSVFIYNKKHNLITEHFGEISISAILKEIDNDKKS